MASDSLTDHEEHERRFLVNDLSILEWAPYREIEQAYLWAEGTTPFRVRPIRSPSAPEDAQAFLTLKRSWDEANPYMRYQAGQIIDPVHAETIVRIAQYVVLKKHYAVISGEMTFDVDVFQGADHSGARRKPKGSGSDEPPTLRQRRGDAGQAICE